jgi:hypothetical protein
MINMPIELIALFTFMPMVALTVWLYCLAYAYTDEAESYLPNSSHVNGLRSSFDGAGIFGKSIRCSGVVTVLMFPDLCAKKVW